MFRHRAALPIVLLLLLAAGSWAAADGADDAGGARVYTNADLDRLGPPPAEPSRPVARPDPAGWDEVIAFIERENSKIDARRKAEESRREYVVVPQRRRVWGGYGYYGYYGYDGGKRGRVGDRRPIVGAGPRAVNYYENHGIRPIHAGPSKTMQMRARAIAGAKH